MGIPCVVTVKIAKHVLKRNGCSVDRILVMITFPDHLRYLDGTVRLCRGCSDLQRKCCVGVPLTDSKLFITVVFLATTVAGLFACWWSANTVTGISCVVVGLITGTSSLGDQYCFGPPSDVAGRMRPWREIRLVLITNVESLKEGVE